MTKKNNNNNFLMMLSAFLVLGLAFMAYTLSSDTEVASTQVVDDVASIEMNLDQANISDVESTMLLFEKELK